MALATSMRSPNSWLTSFRYGRLPAPGAGAGELEQRLEGLGALHRVVGQQGAVQLRDGLEEVPVRSLRARDGRAPAPY